ncbi:hypothetical protein [Pseudoxanthomonas sp.]|uniref:hypothetical protein n=1 Tax=Pseudoxanthomonas sp. TaxID=1871049 RepID=UPI002632677B|nr:hypothetical protein [Pseudoxanthomonas sp.]WDS34998.1 MAG: hypothetical protein O8I58_11490 [Pseudoxanthomonas sp.]
MRPRRPLDVRLRLILILLMPSLLMACGKSPPAAQITAPAEPTPPPPVAASTPTVASTPCELITDAELHAVFSSTVSSRPERHDAFGIAACEWNGDFGRLLLQQWPSKGHTPQDEVRDLVSGFIDTGMPGARSRVRLVSLQGLGNFATAVVEARDAKNGVLADIAVLSIARNGQTLVFLTDGLDEDEREEALRKLRELGHYAYARL